jgi:hypothetical protein
MLGILNFAASGFGDDFRLTLFDGSFCQDFNVLPLNFGPRKRLSIAEAAGLADKAALKRACVLSETL